VLITKAPPQVRAAEAKRKREEAPAVQVEEASVGGTVRQPRGEPSAEGKRQRLDPNAYRGASPGPSTSGQSGTSRLSRSSWSPSFDVREEEKAVYRRAIFETRLKRETAERELGGLIRDFREKFGEDFEQV
jgi:hypothetical protein